MPAEPAAPLTIYIGADHRGFAKKEELKTLLTNSQINVTVVDKGATTQDPADDFNDPAQAVAQAVAQDPTSRGILLCGSAHGVCIQANRYRGVRAINADTSDSAQIGRRHNDANILCLSADRLTAEQMLTISETFLTTPFDGDERLARRIRLLDEAPAASPNSQEEQ